MDLKKLRVCTVRNPEAFARRFGGEVYKTEEHVICFLFPIFSVSCRLVNSSGLCIQDSGSMS